MVFGKKTVGHELKKVLHPFFLQEKHEHPEFSDGQIWSIVKDHYKLGEYDEYLHQISSKRIGNVMG